MYRFLLFGLLIGCLVVYGQSNECYKAKTCLHSSNEVCGGNKQDQFRRFLDNCDIHEYNCEQKTDFKQVNMERCFHLPPIEEVKEGQKEVLAAILTSLSMEK